MMHYTVEVGPVKNSTAGLWTFLCFRDQDTAIQAGRATLRNIERGRGRYTKTIETRHETELHTVLDFDGVPTWHSQVRECHSEGCHVRVRLPKPLQPR